MVRVLIVEDDIVIGFADMADFHCASPLPAARGTAAGIVMTRFLDQTILRREPRGLAPLTRVH